MERRAEASPRTNRFCAPGFAEIKYQTLRLTIAYNGKYFKGWQKGNGRTVQGELERTILALLPSLSQGAIHPDGWTADQLYLIGAGRTDAGVHAEGQVASLRVPPRVNPSDLLRFVNPELPDDVAVLSCETASDRFHAQYQARDKTYRYRIIDGPVGDPFKAPFSWRIPEVLNADTMETAAKTLLGTHDFSSLTADKSKKNHRKTIFDISVERREHQVDITVRGDGFLWNQVRIMAALLIQVGKGQINYPSILTLLEKQDRSLAPPPAPAQGLTLVSVTY